MVYGVVSYGVVCDSMVRNVSPSLSLPFPFPFLSLSFPFRPLSAIWLNETSTIPPQRLERNALHMSETFSILLRLFVDGDCL